MKVRTDKLSMSSYGKKMFHCQVKWLKAKNLTQSSIITYLFLLNLLVKWTGDSANHKNGRLQKKLFNFHNC